MSALPPHQMRALRETATHANEPAGSLAKRWEELHQTGAHLAQLADLTPEAFDDQLAAFPALIGNASQWQREMAWQGVEDIDAMMRPGLAALHAVMARGNDANAPALALWREFHHAREAVLAVVQPQSESAPNT